MGLLDIAEGMLGGNQGSSGNLIGTVMQALNSQPGGLDGVLQSLRQGGLSEAVSSWVGTGANAPLSAGQLQNVLGSGGVVSELASKLGISPDTAASQLSQLLPGIVDHLTPNGEVPQGGLAGAGMSLLQGLLSKKFGA